MPTFTETDWTMGELEDVDLEELVRLIQEGYTSGRLDNGEGQHIYFELRYNIWKDN